MRRATLFCAIGKDFEQISIHALREESDVDVVGSPRESEISIHALREESDRKSTTIVKKSLYISIHALREESDKKGILEFGETIISIHALREESDFCKGSFILKH